MNRHETQAPIDKLPIEILTHVFLVAQEFAGPEYSDKFALSRSLSQVSSHWRRIAIVTSSLWKHICVKTNQTDYDYAASLLQRSASHPIYLYLIDDEREVHDNEDDSDTDSNEEDVILDELLAFLSEAGSRIYALHLESSEMHFDSALNLLSFLLDRGCPDAFKQLRINHSGATTPADIWELDWNDSGTDSPRRCESAMSPVEVLHLVNVNFLWDSTAYAGLVDLRCLFTVIPTSIEALDFMHALAASPTLNILKICGLGFESLDEWDSSITVHMPCLEVLYLSDLSDTT
ncbi:F-box-like protein [Ceratobasidium sp. AG-Ba]|nr:F-box-like protein [Ceratobasidium sp. AG-Ba]